MSSWNSCNSLEQSKLQHNIFFAMISKLGVHYISEVFLLLLKVPVEYCKTKNTIGVVVVLTFVHL